MNNLTINKILPKKVHQEISNNMVLNGTYIGIDFGTSTTVVSVATIDYINKSFSASPISLSQKLYDGSMYKSYKVPTMLAFYNNSLLVGEGANQIKLKLKKDKNFWHSFKMELGEDIGIKYPESELNSESVSILNPKDAARLFFKYLKKQIEKYVEQNNLSKNINYAISIPASFEANQRKDLLYALQKNGIDVSHQVLIDEPNAAFLSYISNKRYENTINIYDDSSVPTNILVFDFGAGTCDISILEVGYGFNGFYSKNLSISKFDEIGGNNIDTLIAIDVLFQQFIEQNNLDKNYFGVKELSKQIIPRFEKIAEQLKIEVSDKLALMLPYKNDKEVVSSTDGVYLNQSVELRTRKGIFTLSKPFISYKAFFDICNIFLNESTKRRVNDNFEFKGVFYPIISALKKANLSKDDIDYVLFIGGSSKNIVIQQAIKDYFDQSEHLVPEDLQAHVSQGAAIHSLVYNGFGKNIIEPVTSEPFMAIIKDDLFNLKTIVKAGTTIPSDEFVIDHLYPQHDGQKTIELPICVGSADKILHVLKIDSHENSGFSLSSEIRLTIRISADKMLIIKAEVEGNKLSVESINPFSNKEYSVKQRKRFVAEKNFNQSCSESGGIPTRSSLMALYREYQSLDLPLKSAEVAEQLHDLFDAVSLNNIAIHYSDAGDKERALYFYHCAMDEDPDNSVIASNLAIEYRYKDQKLFVEWLKKSLSLNGDNEVSLFLYGKHLIDHGSRDEGYQKVNQAFDLWFAKYKSNRLSSYSWFISCANFLRKYDLVAELESKTEQNNKDDALFKAENLLQHNLRLA